MKIITAVITASAILCTPFSARAEDGEIFSETINGNTFYYTMSDKLTATITDSEITNGEVNVPSLLGGCPVMSIGEKAFFGKTEMYSITLPESITRIGDNAFAGCVSLKSITIPEAVIYIGTECFTSCIELEKAVFDCRLSAIPENCFYACTSLNTVNIPDSVMIIGEKAFFGCMGLSGIFIPPYVETIGENAVGMRYNARTNRIEAINGFRIKGLPDTTAQVYAEESGVEFKYNLGDVNFDGFVDSIDSSIVLIEYSILSTDGESTLNNFQRIPADYDKSGFVDSVDASMILVEYARLQTLPEEER